MDEVKLLPCEDEIVPAAAAIVDIWMGGDTAWRARLDDSDFLESADWQNALELARAAIEATRPTLVTGQLDQGAGDPTQFGDDVAAEMRAYFEAHQGDRWHEGWADNLMLGLFNIAVRAHPQPGPSK